MTRAVARSSLLRSVSAAALCVAALACSKPADPPAAAPGGEVRSAPASDALQKALLGAWRLDQQALARDPEIAKLPPDAKAQAMVVLRGLMEGTRMQFGADGALQMTFGKRTQTGRYTIVGAQGAALTLETTTGEGERAKTERITARVEGDRLTVTGPDGKALDLIREGSALETQAPAAPASQAAPTSQAATTSDAAPPSAAAPATTE
ncbi:MAG: hypothetical protein H6702_19355 [Myxococcales bacterium]|nr:hypothetical protein [Myxococcales bacterium]